MSEAVDVQIYSLQGERNNYSFTEQSATLAGTDWLEKILAVKQAATALSVITDPFDYQGIDQVIPMQPEQYFMMDYLLPTDVQGANVLEVGLGSGVLSIYALQQGAAKVTGLEINPKAKVYAGFNALINGVSDRLAIRDGDVNSIFSPVQGVKFDLIISNPPFEPTPPGMDYYLNSAAGIYGFTFLEKMLASVVPQLSDSGVLQIVTMAPGNLERPEMLIKTAREYLPQGATEIICDLAPITYDAFVDRFVGIFGQDKSLIETMKTQAATDGVTHLHMCILRYRHNAPSSLSISSTPKIYEPWETPLGIK